MRKRRRVETGISSLISSDRQEDMASIQSLSVRPLFVLLYGVYLPLLYSMHRYSCNFEEHEDNKSDPGIFDGDAEPDTLNEYEYYFKNPLLQTVEEVWKLHYARCLDDLGNFILEQCL